MNHKQPLCHTTPRIELLCRLSAPYNTIADIGCDHAYVSIHLARIGKTMFASDIAEGPLLKAKKNIAAFGLEDKITLRLFGGLSGLKKGEAEEIIIAGMGGNIISEILKADLDVAKSSSVLFLQPMTAPEILRKFLYENGFLIKNEHLVKEDRRIYTIIEAFYTGESIKYSEIDLFFSGSIRENILLPLYKEYVEKKYAEFKKIADGIKKSDTNEKILSYYISLINETEKILNIKA